MQHDIDRRLFRWHDAPPISVLQAASTSVASVVFLLIGGALGEIGWRATFWVYALCVLLIPIVFLVVWNPESTEGRSPATAATESFPWLFMTGMWPGTLFAAIIFFIVPIQTANLLTGIGVGQPGLIGLTTAIGAINLAIGGASHTRFARYRLGLTLAASFALIAIGLALMVQARSLSLLIIGIVPTGLGSGFLVPALLNWTMSHLSLAHRTRGVGSWYGMFFLGQFFSPLFVLALAWFLGGLPAGLTAIAMASALGSLGCAIWGLTKRSRPITVDLI